MAEKQSPLYKKPTDAQRKKIGQARKRTREGMEGQKDFLSKISTTMAKDARDEEKMGRRMMEQVPEPVRRFEAEEGAPPMGPFKKGGKVKSKAKKYASGGKVRSSCDGIAKKGKTKGRMV
jgi:hypothetical protein